MLLIKIFFCLLFMSLSLLCSIVGYQLRRGNWLKLLAGNWEQDIPLRKAQKIGKSTGTIMYVCTIFFIVLTIYIIV